MVQGGPVLVRVDLGDIIEMDHESITACQSRGQDGSEGGTCPLPATHRSGTPSFTIDRRSDWLEHSLEGRLAWNVHNGNKTIVRLDLGLT
ncbi:hypothetical protein GCM10023096_37420 [Nonomuraea ferruginea]